MVNLDTFKNLRLNGDYKKAVSYLIDYLKQNQSPTPSEILIEFAYLMLLVGHYDLAWFYYNQYVTSSKKTAFSDSDLIFLLFLKKKLTDNKDWLLFFNTIEFNELTLPPTKPTIIKNIDFELSNEITYYFLVSCPHCDHNYYIYTDASFLIELEDPCPKCFNPTYFSYDTIFQFLVSNNLNTVIDYWPIELPQTNTSLFIYSLIHFKFSPLMVFSIFHFFTYKYSE